MFANNEQQYNQLKKSGTIKEHNILFHTDAVQAVGNIDIDVHKLNIDMLSMSGHKIHAPKGVECYILRKDYTFRILFMAGKERKRRAGTENVPSIVGLGTACERAERHLEEHIAHCRKLRDRLIENHTKMHIYIRLQEVWNIDFPELQAFISNILKERRLLLSLDMKGIAGSSGSACNFGVIRSFSCFNGIGFENMRLHMAH